MLRRDWLAASVAGCLACRKTSQMRLRRLRVSTPMTVTAASFHLAEELGYFREAGFDIEHVPRTNALEMFAAMAAGKVDVQLTAIGVPFLNAVSRGVPVRIVAGREEATPSCLNVGVIGALRRNFPGGLSDLRRLKGKRIVTGPTIGIRYFILDELLAQDGLSIRDVTPLTLGWPESYAALLSGTADAMLLLDEILAGPRTAELVFSRRFAEIHPGFQYSFVFFARSLLEGDVQAGKRFLEAYFRGAREYVAGKSPGYLKKFAEYRGVEVSQVENVCRNSFATRGAISRKSLQMYAEWAYRRGYVPRQLEVHELADLRFVGELNA